MSHEFESGCFYKDPAWHKLGTVIDHVMTAKEAITAAGLDFYWVEIFATREAAEKYIEQSRGKQNVLSTEIL